MSVRLEALNIWLRAFERPALARARDIPSMRRRLERSARVSFRDPQGAQYGPDRLRLSDRTLGAEWASCGRPHRRRLLLYLHGGGYLLGAPRTHRHLAADLAGRIGCRALLPDYRLAPEHPFPAAVEDAAEVYALMLDRGYEPGAIVVAGDSAGGGLAFAMLARIGEMGLPAPAALAAFSPYVDLRFSTPSHRRNARRDVLLPAARFADARRRYLCGASPEDPLASPVLARFRSPPPTLIQASRSELMADDAEAMAETLRAAGGDARLEYWERTPHAWQIFRGRLPEADAALRRAATFLRRALDRNGEG